MSLVDAMPLGFVPAGELNDYRAIDVLPRQNQRRRRPAPTLPPAPPVKSVTALAPRAYVRAAGAAPRVVPSGNSSAGYLLAKRTLDIAGALVLLALLGPVMLITLAVLLATTRGRPIFVQERVGQCGRRFRMFKFRSMKLDAAALQHLVANEKQGPIFKNRRDPRITRVGRLLRSTSIDETPQLINVLLGHMSLVGPRPPVPAEVAKYQAWQRARLAIKPGLTCLWQVSGRSEIGFDDWVRMDLWYLRHQNLWTDFKLLVRTPWSVLSRRGAY